MLLEGLWGATLADKPLFLCLRKMPLLIPVMRNTLSVLGHTRRSNFPVIGSKISSSRSSEPWEGEGLSKTEKWLSHQCTVTALLWIFAVAPSDSVAQEKAFWVRHNFLVCPGLGFSSLRLSFFLFQMNMIIFILRSSWLMNNSPIRSRGMIPRSLGNDKGS